MAYIFGGNTGIRTPQEAKHLRDIAEAMASRGRTPSNIGEGLTAIGDAIASRRYRMRADRMESEGRAAYQSKYGDLLKSFFGGGGAAPAVPEAPDSVDPEQPDLTQAPREYPMGVGGMLSSENAANTQLPPEEDQAAIVRTVIGEAGNQSPEGQRAVAEVILNRARATGMTPQQVVMAKGQFEPWQTRAAELNAIDPNSQAYQSVLANITPAFGLDDPTGGADHFYAPEAQAALGRDTPDWAEGQTGRDIGDHRFYSLGYGGEPGASGAQGAATEQAAGEPGIQQVADSGGIDPQRIIDALSDPWLPDGQKAVLQAILEQRMQEMDPDYQTTEIGGDLYQVSPNRGTTRKILDLPPAPDKPDPEIRRYEYAKQGGFTGTFEDWMKLKDPMVTVNTGDVGAGDIELRKSLSKKEGERWDALQEAGTVSGSMMQDMTVLDELIKVAPQSPLAGRLVEMFPGMSTTGAAFQSIVTRVAPSLRTPGSGAQSDIEYEGFLNSMPRLRNYPEANQLISEVMKQKQALNIERADVITAYQNEEIPAKEARSKLAELNKRSILSPKMRSLLDAQDPKASPEGSPKPGDIEDGHMFKGGDPADRNNWVPVS